MASPHVAGAVALMFQKKPDLTNDQIRNALQNSVRTDSDMGTLPNDEWGFGKLNAFAAVEALAGAAPNTPAPSPNLLAPPGEIGGLALQPPPFMAFSPGLLQLVETPAGREYAAVVRRHVHEVRHLIRSNRRVAVYWRRLGGAQFVQELLDTAAAPDRLLPVEVNGKPVINGLRQLLAALKKYGSAALSRDIDRYGEKLEMLPGMSLDHLLEQLRVAE